MFVLVWCFAKYGRVNYRKSIRREAFITKIHPEKKNDNTLCKAFDSFSVPFAHRPITWTHAQLKKRFPKSKTINEKVSQKLTLGLSKSPEIRHALYLGLHLRVIYPGHHTDGLPRRRVSMAVGLPSGTSAVALLTSPYLAVARLPSPRRPLVSVESIVNKDGSRQEDLWREGLKWTIVLPSLV